MRVVHMFIIMALGFGTTTTTVRLIIFNIYLMGGIGRDIYTLTVSAEQATRNSDIYTKIY